MLWRTGTSTLSSGRPPPSLSDLLLFIINGFKSAEPLIFFFLKLPDSNRSLSLRPNQYINPYKDSLPSTQVCSKKSITHDEGTYQHSALPHFLAFFRQNCLEITAVKCSRVRRRENVSNDES